MLRTARTREARWRTELGVQNDCEGDALGNDAIDAAEAWPGDLAESFESCGFADGFDD